MAKGGQKMGNVIIIRNNNRKSDIYKFAKDSYCEEKIGYYNTVDGSANESYLKK